MDRSNHRPPNPGVIILIALPLLGPLLIGAVLYLLAGFSVILALVIGYAVSIVAAPPLALLANRLIGHRRSRRAQLAGHVQTKASR